MRGGADVGFWSIYHTGMYVYLYVYVYAVSLGGCAFMPRVQGDILSRLRQAWMTSKPGFYWHHFASISRPLLFLTARLR